MAIERDEASLIEEATAAWRALNPDGTIRPHRSWLDLPEDARARVFEETVKVRKLEAALSPKALSGTAELVLRRIRGER